MDWKSQAQPARLNFPNPSLANRTARLRSVRLLSPENPRRDSQSQTDQADSGIANLPADTDSRVECCQETEQAEGGDSEAEQRKQNSQRRYHQGWICRLAATTRPTDAKQNDLEWLPRKAEIPLIDRSPSFKSQMLCGNGFLQADFPRREGDLCDG